MDRKDICSPDNNPDKKENANSIASLFFSLPPKQFTLLSTLLGIQMTENLNIDQQNTLGNFLVGVGTAILTSAGQSELIKEQNNDK